MQPSSLSRPSSSSKRRRPTPDPPSPPPPAPPPPQPPYLRVLYTSSPTQPDNYTPLNYLSEYLHPLPPPSPSYSTLVFLSLIICARLSAIEAFLSSFLLVRSHRLSPVGLAGLTAALLVSLLALHLLLPSPSPSAPLPWAQGALLAGLLALSSPLLSSLTSSYSDDTLIALTVLLSLLHLLTFDYSAINFPSPARIPTHPVSLACALLLATLLASRVGDRGVAVLLLLQAALLFAVSPAGQQRVRGVGGWVGHTVQCGVWVAVGGGMVGWVGWGWVAVHVAVMALLAGVCSAWMRRADKRTWKGPWDYDASQENRGDNL